MLNGPDYLHPLTKVLMSLRVCSIAVCKDIAEIFHQITIQESGRHAQRFIWLSKASRIFDMRAMTFGIGCASCIKSVGL